ncbi:unnamed protein product [Diamesa hyperborea]
MADKIAEYTPKIDLPSTSSSFNNNFNSGVSKNNTFVITNIIYPAKSTNDEKKYLSTSGDKVNEENTSIINQLVLMKMEMDELVKRKLKSKDDIQNDLKTKFQNEVKSNDPPRIKDLKSIQKEIDVLMYRKAKNNDINRIGTQTKIELNGIRGDIDVILNKNIGSNEVIPNDSPTIKDQLIMSDTTIFQLNVIKNRVDNLLP